MKVDGKMVSMIIEWMYGSDDEDAELSRRNSTLQTRSSRAVSSETEMRLWPLAVITIATHLPITMMTKIHEALQFSKVCL